MRASDLSPGEKRNFAPRRGACVCGVTECPVTNLFFVSRGWQQGRESATNEDTLVTLVKQLETSSCVPAMVVQSPFGPLFLSLCVLHVDSVTFSPLEGNRVPCEPKLIILETFRLYSKLISCTRKISTLHLEFKCVCVFVCCGGCGGEWPMLQSPEDS